LKGTFQKDLTGNIKGESWIGDKFSYAFVKTKQNLYYEG